MAERFGHGGMAEIYRATMGPDPATYAFELALKRMHAHLEKDPTQVDMFLTEADIAKFLQHPNLVRVFETGLVDNRAYISMEYVWGHDMSRLITLLAGRGQRFPADLAIHVALRLLRAVDYIHRARSPGGASMELVHRDVTPSNLYMTLGGEVKLGDFGVARISFLEPSEEARFLKGKVAYMPPEVLAGEPVSQKVDLWGVASILYEMLTAQHVYGEVGDDALREGNTPPLVPVQKVVLDIDPRLARIVNNSLSPKPKKRPRDALAFYQELKVYLQDTGIDVGPQGLARFLTEVTGSRAQAARTEGQQRLHEGSFHLPDYQVPVGPSPTTRFQQRERKKARLRPVIVGASVLMVAAIVFAVYRVSCNPTPARTRSNEAVGVIAPNPTERPADEGSKRVEAKAKTDSGMDFEEGEGDVGDVGDVRTGADAGLDIDLEGVDTETIQIGEVFRIKDPAARFNALVHRGQVEAKLSRPQTSLEAYQAASELKPNDPRARLGQARALLNLTRFADAEVQVDLVLKMRPRHGSAYLLLGDLASAEGELEKARQAYERCIEAEPKSAAARSARKALTELQEE